MADFSGAARSAAPTFAAARLTADDVDGTVEMLAPAVPIAVSDERPPTQALPIATLEDLHPDNLATVLPELRQPLEWAALLDSSTTEARGLAAVEAATGPLQRPAASSTASAAPAAGGNDELFGRLLGRARAEGGNDAAKERVSRLIKSALGEQTAASASSVVPAARARIAALLDERCRRVLREPGLRAVERAWRSAQWLVSRLEDDEAEVHILDLSKPRLVAHLAEFKDRLDQSPLARVLTAEADGGWDLVVGDYSFGLSADDVLTLATVGALAARASTVFFAHGELSLAGCADEDAVDSPGDWRYEDEELAALWAEFRRHPAARAVALATPRFLLRQPYGKRTDAATRFAFEELPVRPDRESFLWGNPAFACALIAARTGVTEAGGEVNDLPMPVYGDGTGDAIQPPVEYLFGERAQATLATHGLIALVGGRNTDRVVVPHLDRAASR
jgi:type VI secretion system ImpC/EvpB family protein